MRAASPANSQVDAGLENLTAKDIPFPALPLNLSYKTQRDEEKRRCVAIRSAGLRVCR